MYRGVQSLGAGRPRQRFRIRLDVLAIDMQQARQAPIEPRVPGYGSEPLKSGLVAMGRRVRLVLYLLVHCHDT